MNSRALLCAGLTGLACTVSASAEEMQSRAAPSVIGFMDPQTGALLPLMATTASPEIAAASTAVTGTLKITGTFITSIPTTVPVQCTATAVVVADPNGPITESVSTTATRKAESLGAICTMLIPYEWILQTLTDKVTLSVSVSAPTRVHTRQLATFVVPANGVTTSFTFFAHL